jgi:glycosyltransferase involved in cell wall biosynthesis
MTPLISIVTPSLNQSHFLREALESVRNQQYPAVEHIVLDGCSTDGSQRILQDFEKTPGSTAFWWRSGRDGGQSVALNEGFARASGEIVGWLNADDRYRAGCFQAVAAAFAEHPEVDVLYGDYNLMDAAGDHVAVRREIEFSRFILRYHRVLYIPTAATFFRRRVFEHGHILSSSLHYAMDLEFFLRLADAGCRFQHLPEVLADFRVHPASKSVAFRSLQRAEHRSVVLRATPLVHHFASPGIRNLAATSLQLPAALLRYGEKLLRGFYFPSSRAPGQHLPVISRPEQS